MVVVPLQHITMHTLAKNTYEKGLCLSQIYIAGAF